jgi:hypothetical protein
MANRDDEYHDLQIAARDALYALLKETEPGTGIYLHQAYGNLRGDVERWEQAQEERRQKEARRRQQEKYAERDRRGAILMGLPRAGRERFVLELLGEDRLTLRELTERVQVRVCEQVGCEGDPRIEAGVYEQDVRRTVMRMWRARELDRTPEPIRPGGKPIRYRYFRRGLEGPIAELERAFHGGEGEGETR